MIPIFSRVAWCQQNDLASNKRCACSKNGPSNVQAFTSTRRNAMKYIPFLLVAATAFAQEQTCFSSNRELRNAVTVSFAPHLIETSNNETTTSATEVEEIYGNVETWCFEDSLTDLSGIFEDVVDFNEDISAWQTLNIISLDRLFYNATSFNQNVKTWDTSKVISIQSTFELANSFNQPLDTWDVGAVENFQAMFARTKSFDQDLSSWKTVSAKNFNSLFRQSVFVGDVSTWDTSKVTTTISMFRENARFDGDLSKWKLSSVTDMDSMFDGCTAFRGSSVSSWDVSNVRNMHDMFKDAANFNANLGGWNVGNVETMEGMFQDATKFTGEGVLGWDTSKCTNFVDTFHGAVSFNQDLSSWDVTNADDMERMFQSATSFRQDLCSWKDDLSAAASFPIVEGMFEGTDCEETNDPADIDGPFCATCEESSGAEQCGAVVSLLGTFLLLLF